MVAENILDGTTKMISWRDVASTQSGICSSLTSVHAMNTSWNDRGAVNIPLDELREHLDEIPKNRKIIAFCGVGLRAHVACRILMQSGFPEVYNLSCGLKTYETATQKQSNEDIFANDYIGHDDHIYQGTKEKKAPATLDEQRIKDVDACGLQCPGPVLKLKQSIDSIAVGEAIRIKASDAGFYKDVRAWANVTGNDLVDLRQDGAEITAIVRKAEPSTRGASQRTGKGTTLICFSDDLDKALAIFIIANGAAASGKKSPPYSLPSGGSCHKTTGESAGKKRLRRETVRHDDATVKPQLGCQR